MSFRERVCVWVLCLHFNSVNTCHVCALINMVLSSAWQRLPNKLTAEQAVGSNRGEQEANQLTFPPRRDDYWQQLTASIQTPTTQPHSVTHTLVSRTHICPCLSSHTYINSSLSGPSPCMQLIGAWWGSPLHTAKQWSRQQRISPANTNGVTEWPYR